MPGKVSASGEVYRGPGAPATGPLRHYTFELFALDTKIDVPPGADAWPIRTSVYNALQGTSSAGPCTSGCSGGRNEPRPGTLPPGPIPSRSVHTTVVPRTKALMERCSGRRIEAE